MGSDSVTTEATGRVQAPPDVATVEITARREGETATGAHAAARDCAATIRETLAGEDVPVEDIRTVAVEIEDGTQRFDGGDNLRATERLVVECPPGSAADVVTTAADVGGTVPTAGFHLREEHRRALEEEALATAAERARRKAERLAGAAGREIAGVREMRTEDGSGMESIVDEALAGSPDGDVHPDPIAVTETVEVVYELSD